MRRKDTRPLAADNSSVMPEEPRLDASASAAKRATVELIVIGVSTGGPSALEQMLPSLPRDFAVPVMVVQHMPKLFTGALAERLDRVCTMRVRQAQRGSAIEAGVILLAPGGTHMEVAASTLGGRQGRVVKLHEGPALHSCKPAVDYLFRSAAATYGAGTLAVVMTGMGTDGLDGALRVKQAGGVVLAQDEASSAVWGMPGRVVREGLAAGVLPLQAMAAELVARVAVGRGRGFPAEPARQDEVRCGVF